MGRRGYYFSTRDLIQMAALAALGGVSSTYVNAVGDVVQSALGFAGTTQWAAGVHVLWLLLAASLTRKLGAATVTGVLKGAVELLSGNTHGLLVVLIDLVAGVLVDLVLFLFRKKDSLPALTVAGGAASASNVFVFQLFASLPADVLAYGALLLVGGVAFLSGAILAGLLAYLLLEALRRAGLVHAGTPIPVGRRVYGLFAAGAVVLVAATGGYLYTTLRGPATVRVGGAVANPFDYPRQHGDVAAVTAEGTLRGVTSRYTGVPIRELVARAGPQTNAGLLLIRAADGYAFFVSMAELADNPALLLASQGEGDRAAYNLVGARNSKAWVRGVVELAVIEAATLDFAGAVDAPAAYDPDAWQYEMDSTSLDVGYGKHKYQGAPLREVLSAMSPRPTASTVLLYASGAPVDLPLAQVLADDDVRLFTIINEGKVSFAVARMDGTVIASRVDRVEVR